MEYPFDTVKVMLQSDSRRQYKGPVDVFVQVSKTRGVMALYRGLTSPLLGAMAENSVLFVTYGIIKKQLNVVEDPTLTNRNPLWKYFLSGGASGVAAAFVLTPVELIKCRIQVQQITEGAPRFKGPIDCVLQTVRSDGFTGLWKGNVSCLMREIPGNMAWFGTYEIIRGQIQMHCQYEKLSDMPLYWTALAGASAGVAYWAVPFPADTVKSRIQTNPRFASMSFAQAFRTVLKEEGVRGLYQGLGITCLRAAPSHALIFYFYELSYDLLGRL